MLRIYRKVLNDRNRFNLAFDMAMAKIPFTIAMIIAMYLILMPPSYARSVNARFSAPIADGTVSIRYECAKQSYNFTVEDITAVMTAEMKRDRIFDSMKPPKSDIAVEKTGDASDPGIGFYSLCDDSTLTITTDTTGEESFLSAKEIGFAALTFDREYNVSAQDGSPAKFEVGIVTDLGQATFTYRADNSNGEVVDGQEMVDWLFAGLTEPARSLGAELERNGDQIIVYFLDGVSNEHAGVIFKSTSESGAISGTIETGIEQNQEIGFDASAGASTLYDPEPALTEGAEPQTGGLEAVKITNDSSTGSLPLTNTNLRNVEQNIVFGPTPSSGEKQSPFSGIDIKPGGQDEGITLDEAYAERQKEVEDALAEIGEGKKGDRGRGELPTGSDWSQVYVHYYLLVKDLIEKQGWSYTTTGNIFVNLGFTGKGLCDQWMERIVDNYEIKTSLPNGFRLARIIRNPGTRSAHAAVAIVKETATKDNRTTDGHVIAILDPHSGGLPWYDVVNAGKANVFSLKDWAYGDPVRFQLLGFDAKGPTATLEKSEH